MDFSGNLLLERCSFKGPRILLGSISRVEALPCQIEMGDLLMFPSINYIALGQLELLKRGTGRGLRAVKTIIMFIVLFHKTSN